MLPDEPDPIRVLIADDHGLVRAGLRSLLGSEPDMQVVGEAADGSQALSLAQKLRPDVVLADISMPPPDGIEVARQLKDEADCCRTLIVSMHEDPGLVRDALAAGAFGYVVKRALEGDLVTAVREVAGGRRYVHRDLKPLPQPVASPQTPASSAGSAIDETELRLLRLMAQGATTQSIAAALSLTVEQVQSRRLELMARLDFRNRIDVIKFIQQHDPPGN